MGKPTMAQLDFEGVQRVKQIAEAARQLVHRNDKVEGDVQLDPYRVLRALILEDDQMSHRSPVDPAPLQEAAPLGPPWGHLLHARRMHSQVYEGMTQEYTNKGFPIPDHLFTLLDEWYGVIEYHQTYLIAMGEYV